MSAIDSAIQEAELAGWRSARSTTRGMTAKRAGRKNMLTAVIAKTIGYAYPTFAATASGRRSTRPARRRSLAIITSLAPQRSTKVPAIGPTRRLGTVAPREPSPPPRRGAGPRRARSRPPPAPSPAQGRGRPKSANRAVPHHHDAAFGLGLERG